MNHRRRDQSVQQWDCQRSFSCQGMRRLKPAVKRTGKHEAPGSDFWWPGYKAKERCRCGAHLNELICNWLPEVRHAQRPRELERSGWKVDGLWKHGKACFVSPAFNGNEHGREAEWLEPWFGTFVKINREVDIQTARATEPEKNTYLLYWMFETDGSFHILDSVPIVTANPQILWEARTQKC